MLAEAVSVAAPNAACMVLCMKKEEQIDCQSWRSEAFGVWSKGSGCGIVGIRGTKKGVG